MAVGAARDQYSHDVGSRGVNERSRNTVLTMPPSTPDGLHVDVHRPALTGRRARFGRAATLVGRRAREHHGGKYRTTDPAMRRLVDEENAGEPGARPQTVKFVTKTLRGVSGLPYGRAHRGRSGCPTPDRGLRVPQLPPTTGTDSPDTLPESQMQSRSAAAMAVAVADRSGALRLAQSVAPRRSRGPGDRPQPPCHGSLQPRRGIASCWTIPGFVRW
jgi:hypothetical protein